jgi:hypothetical protein
MSEFLLRAIQAGLMIDSSVVPDVSVGMVWSKHWVESGLSATYGARIKHEHNYPSHYPQAASNPQDIWVYPIESLGQFRQWLDAVYIPQKFPKYLDGQVKKKTMASAMASGLLAAVTPAHLEDGEDDEENEDEEDGDDKPPVATRRSKAK